MSCTETKQPSTPILKWVPLPQPITLPAPNSLVTRIAEADSRLPCRRCLLDSEAGEAMHLISYNPFPADAKSSPYQGAGPIFVHARDCALYTGADVPEQQRQRLLAVKAYDGEHMMVDNEVLQGTELVQAAGKMLSRDGVQYLHVHNAAPGCFAVRVERG